MKAYKCSTPDLDGKGLDRRERLENELVKATLYVSLSESNLKRSEVGEEIHVVISLNNNHKTRPVREPSHQDPPEHKEKPRDRCVLACERIDVVDVGLLFVFPGVTACEQVEPHEGVDVNDILEGEDLRKSGMQST